MKHKHFLKLEVKVIIDAKTITTWLLLPFSQIAYIGVQDDGKSAVIKTVDGRALAPVATFDEIENDLSSLTAMVMAYPPADQASRHADA